MSFAADAPALAGVRRAAALYWGKEAGAPSAADRTLLQQNGLFVAGGHAPPAARTAQAAVAAMQLADLARVLAAFDDAGVPVVVLKGLPLSLAAYGALAARPSGDIDLLVAPEHAAAAAAALRAAGATHLPSDYADATVATWRAPAGSVVELHHTVGTATPFTRLGRALIASRRVVALDGLRVPVPGEPEHFVYLLVHLARHIDTLRLVWVEDVRRLLPALDWAAVLAVVARTGSAHAAALALGAADALLAAHAQTRPPAHVLATIEGLRPRGERALLDLLVPHLRHGARPAAHRLYAFLLDQDWADRRRLARDFVARRILASARNH